MRYIVKKAKKRPAALQEAVHRHHDNETEEAKLEEHIAAKIDADGNIDNS